LRYSHAFQLYTMNHRFFLFLCMTFFVSHHNNSFFNYLCFIFIIYVIRYQGTRAPFHYSSSPFNFQILYHSVIVINARMRLTKISRSSFFCDWFSKFRLHQLLTQVLMAFIGDHMRCQEKWSEILLSRWREDLHQWCQYNRARLRSFTDVCWLYFVLKNRLRRFDLSDLVFPLRASFSCSMYSAFL
jgi:hypothetical protein